MKTSILFISLLLVAGSVFGDESTGEQSFVVDKFLSEQESQKQKMKGVQMDVEIDASIPKLAKKGTMKALRVISNLGKVTYDYLKFDGDNMVKKEVIARYLAQEAQAVESPNPKLAINPENYKFKLKGLQTKDNREVYVLEVNPRKKIVGAFKGELWLDSQTYLTVRESGRFVKSPSVFLKKVEFVREYEIRDGIAVPTKMTSYADTRIVGRTELNISYTNFSRVSTPDVTESLVGTVR